VCVGKNMSQWEFPKIKRRGRAHTDRALGQFFFFYAGIGRENTKKK
jgi:hypothetical protein